MPTREAPLLRGSGAPLGPRKQSRRFKGNSRQGGVLPYLLVSPLALFVILLTVVPALFTLGESFFHVDLLGPPIRFAGLDNFGEIFRDPAIVSSFGNTALYVAVGVVLSTLLGVAFA